MVVAFGSLALATSEQRAYTQLYGAAVCCLSTQQESATIIWYSICCRVPAIQTPEQQHAGWLTMQGARLCLVLT
jgi:hypothetical protein